MCKHFIENLTTITTFEFSLALQLSINLCNSLSPELTLVHPVTRHKKHQTTTKIVSMLGARAFCKYAQWNCRGL